MLFDLLDYIKIRVAYFRNPTAIIRTTVRSYEKEWTGSINRTRKEMLLRDFLDIPKLSVELDALLALLGLPD
tara:strand:+ start:393 stop:608 length:216 start_codon:yes stop_codon:yes gene_type:complete